MRFTEITPLTEASGITHRKPGDEFVSTTDPTDKIYVKSVEKYPKGATHYETAELMNADIESIKSKYSDIPVKFTNPFNSSSRAFGVAMFTKADSPEVSIIFIKPFKKLSSILNTWDNQDGLPGYRYNSKVSNKESSGLSPADILAKFKDLTAKDIVDQISKKLGADHPFTDLAKRIASGAQLPIEVDIPPGVEFAAFRDYFCELLQPIALQTGAYTGNAKDAAMRFLNEPGFENTTISFSQSKNEALYDSILTSKSGREIKISTKGGVGAKASVAGLLTVAEILEKSGSKLTDDPAVQDIIHLVKKIKTAGMWNSPLKLGVEYNIISNADVEQINKWRSMLPINLKDLDKVEMSDTLKSIIRGRRTVFPDRVNLYIHSIAAIAHLVADYINKNTNFGTVASTILNNNALVQVYSRVRQVGNKWIINEFYTKWPKSGFAGVKLVAGKPYSSTEIKGNFTFEIDRTDDSATEPSIDTTAVQAVTPSTLQATEPATAYSATSSEIQRQINASVKYWANMVAVKYNITDAATIGKIAQDTKTMIMQGQPSSVIAAHVENLYAPDAVNTRAVVPRSTAPKSPAVFAPFDTPNNVKVKKKQAGTATYRFKR